ncbi:MAG: LamG domain-containing protein [Candidatus Poribacteria bacterium]
MKRLSLFYVSFLIFGLIFVTVSNAKIDFKTAAGIWLFEEKDAVIKDSSKNGNDGKAEASVKHVAGKFGSALSLNGTNAFVTVTDNDSLDLPGAWTITAWIKVNKTEANWGHILGKRDPAAAVVNYAFRTDNVGKGWDAYFATGGAWKGIWNKGTVKSDQWFYMTAVYDSKDVITIYENGAKIGDGAGMGAPAPANAVDVIIGGWKNNATELLDGTLDEVLLIGAMITTDDMNNLMNNGAERALGILSVDKQGKLTTAWGKIKSSR